ncbi:MAG: hypothetical protein LBN32_02485, partial [Helicobacteraceae bacterium]|nr:hypothetical protein [Helicobacteraceae bacterium]
PLGGNRKGKLRRYINLLITMALGGLWHGAAWTFVLWGALHGVMLAINHLWRSAFGGSAWQQSRYWRACAFCVTFCAVVFAWVPFRATTIESAMSIWKGMLGFNGIALPALYKPFLGDLNALIEWLGIPLISMPVLEIGFHLSVLWVVFGLFVCFCLPNSIELMSKYHIAFGAFQKSTSRIYWKPTVLWALFIALLWTFSLISLERVNEFIYYRF